MEDERLEGLMNSLAEDYTWEELHNINQIQKEMVEMMGVNPEHVIPLLYGAIQLKQLRDEKPPFWQEVLKQRVCRH